MAKMVVFRALWREVAPLAPRPNLPPKADGRQLLLKPRSGGLSWSSKLGCPGKCCQHVWDTSGSTCWHRFHAWTLLRVWSELHRRLLRVLGRQGRINLDCTVIDSASVRVLKGGVHTGPNRAYRPKPYESREKLDMLDVIPPCSGATDRPRNRLKRFQGDGAYGIKAIIAAVVQRRVHSLLALFGKTRTTRGSELGRTRYVIEQSQSWMSKSRRLKLYYERFGEHF
jgi:hypothetical protein